MTDYDRKPTYLIGVDLGQANDYTALCVVEMHTKGDGHQAERSYQVRHLDRLPLGTPYPEQVEAVSRVVELVKQQQRAQASPWPSDQAKVRPPRLVVDQTGVGRPVVDMLRKAGHRGLMAVSIHGGDTSSREGSDYRVPKRELVAVTQVLLQTNRLGVAASLPHAQTLTREMLAFKVSFSKTGHDSYGNDWRENPHDDLVLAVALAVWAGESIRYVSERANRALAAWGV